MILSELEDQILKLSLSDRWHLVQSILTSIQRETTIYSPPISFLPKEKSLTELADWTQSLIGVIQLESADLNESYINYLEEKYR